jgi:N utilization substance protein B
VGRRTRARECALQMLYQWDIGRDPVERVFAGFWQVRTAGDEAREMAERMVRGAISEIEAVDAEIGAAASHWRIERIAAVERNVLRLAAWELLRTPETPSAVIIDEAVDLAKRFGEAESFAFVNGVLDAIRRSVRSDGTAAPAPLTAGERPGRS